MKSLMLILAACLLASGPWTHAQTPGTVGPAKPKLQLAYEVDRARSLRTAGGDWDDKQDRISLRLKLKNLNFRHGFDGLRADLYLIGQSIFDRKAFKLLQKDTFEFDLAPSGTFEATTPQITLKWDDTNARFGDKYRGWVLRIFDAANEKVLDVQSSQAFSSTDGLEALKVNQYFDKEFRPLKDPGAR